MAGTLDIMPSPIRIEEDEQENIARIKELKAKYGERVIVLAHHYQRWRARLRRRDRRQLRPVQGRGQHGQSTRYHFLRRALHGHQRRYSLPR